MCWVLHQEMVKGNKGWWEGTCGRLILRVGRSVGPMATTELPSLGVPQHKKLVEGNLYEEVSTASYSENDISNSIKNGILYLEDPIDHVREALRG